MSKNNVPVLLIGLGGIGSSIVNKTYGRLKKEGELDFLEALVFDTDQNELSKLEYIPKECQIQTSTDKSVKYVLDRDENANIWFPSHPKIMNMQLINGAGQIRAVSRLALRSAMKAGKLNNVQSVRDRIYKLGTNAHEKGVRIMIVTSMMGGTGSGMFLQIPLYLREIFQSKFSADTIEIQGIFLLPDVLKGSIDEKQKMNVYANAYASMKELNAIILSLAKMGTNVDLEYRPDQIEKTKDYAVKSWPYDYCYIYDKEDTKGRVLDGIKDYIDMVSENLYSQVYGPISDKMYSYFINTIREIIRKNCRNIFGGIGIGKLIYPYEDIIDYITCRAVSESLKEQLLRINTSYKMKMEQYERNKQAGNDTEKPDLGQHFIDEFNSLAKDNNFFKNINKDICEFDDAGESVSNLAEDYLNEIDDKAETIIEDFIKNNNVSQPNRSSIDNKVEAELKNVIDKKEEEYKNFRSAIDARLDSIAETEANKDFEIYDDKKESFFDKFLKSKKDGKYINPVGVRYILYLIKKYLEQDKSDLNSEIESLKSDLQKREEKKLSGFSKNVSNVYDAVNYAINQDNNPIDKVLFHSMKKFKEQYCDATNKHFKKLKEYALIVYRHSYYRRTLELLSVLIEEYERMFDRLEDQKTGIDRKIEELLHKHEGSLGKTNIYVLGSAQFKEEIWNNLPPTTRLNTLSQVLPEKMHESLKVNCKQKIKNLTQNIVGYDYLFNELILKGCKESLKNDDIINDMIDMNVVAAINKEFEFAKNLGLANDIKDKEQYIKNKLLSIIDRTQPFAAQSDESTDYAIWGINDNLRLPSEGNTDKSLIEKMITEISEAQLSASNTCTDSTYSKYEITYLHSRYGLMVSDFKKFYAGENGDDDGEYYTCYHRLIKDVVDDKRAVGRNIEITPHIDKRWHKTLPDLNDEVNNKNLKDRAKAFVVGLAMGHIIAQEKKITETKSIIEFARSINQTAPTSINAKGEKVTGNLSKLYDGLKYNPDIVEDISQFINNHIDNIKENVSVSDGSLSLDDDKIIKNFYKTKIACYKDVYNVLDIIIKLYPECRTREEMEKNEIFTNIIDNLCIVIENIVKAYYGYEKEVVNENVKNVLKKLLEESNLAKKVKETTDDYNYSIAPINNRIRTYEEN